MLTIEIPLGPEGFNEETGEFVSVELYKLELEHSLISLSKWESKWCKSFLNNKGLTDEETIDYIKCMTLTDGVGDEVYSKLTNDNVTQINDYIAAPMTATTFSDNKGGKGGREIVTSELIYYWMIALNIPFECQYWHLNRLLTLVRVCNIKNAPPKKRSKSDIASQYKALNAQRRAQMNTKG